MLDFILPLLKSKRMWTALITFALHMLVSRLGWKLTSADTSTVIDHLLVAGGAIVLTVTKLMDVAAAKVTK